MAFSGRRRVGCGALRTPTIAEEECGRGVRPGEDAASAAAAAKGWRPFQRAACSSMHGQLKHYISRERAGWVEINSSIYVHLVVEEISF